MLAIASGFMSAPKVILMDLTEFKFTTQLGRKSVANDHQNKATWSHSAGGRVARPRNLEDCLRGLRDLVRRGCFCQVRHKSYSMAKR